MDVWYSGEAMTTLISDVEADNFYDTVSRIHCIVSVDYDTLEVYISPHDFGMNLGRVISYQEHHKLLLAADKTVYHNGLGYDYPVLRKVLGWDLPPISKVDDTFIMSSLFNPDIAAPKGCNKGAHSLKAWGLRMAYEKGDVDSFDIYTLPMLEYCIQDVGITLKLYRKMQAIRASHDWELALKIEYTMARLQAAQAIHGVVLDVPKCYDLVEKLMAETVIIESKILPNVPAKARQVGADVSRPFLMSGGYSKMVTDWYGDEI